MFENIICAIYAGLLLIKEFFWGPQLLIALGIGLLVFVISYIYDTSRQSGEDL